MANGVVKVAILVVTGNCRVGAEQFLIEAVSSLLNRMVHNLNRKGRCLIRKTEGLTFQINQFKLAR